MSEPISRPLRTLVRERAQDRCEYCLIPESIAGDRYEVDHIIAVQHGGPTVSENLAWSCVVCNSSKGPNLASIDKLTGEIVRLFNPRADQWAEHFRLEKGRILPLTAIGRATVHLLDLNNPDDVRTRQILTSVGALP